MRYIVGGMWGGIAGAVMGAILSFGLLMLYCWVEQPSGNMRSSMWAAGVGNFYFTVALPTTVVLGTAIGIAVVMVNLFTKEMTRK